MSEDQWRKMGRPRDPAVFIRIVEETVTKLVKAKVCSCGVEGCRKRKGHERPISEVTETSLRWGGVIPLEEVVPGHERFERAVAYAARDALVALYVSDRIDQMMTGRVPFPWQR